ncbi:MAG: rRNA maturation RNase YbeY [Fluviicola sp.]|jgi:rRNA maturation RNase YbeY|nr:rRNA maturation RNase YbeY [Fluviicola sp.]
MVNLFFEDVEILGLDPEFFISWLSDCCDTEGKSLEEVNLIFCSDEYLLQKNIEFLQHDYYTDIITFDYCQGDLIMGDLFISKDRVIDNAQTNGVSFENELNRVIVHGVLHLCGYKDKSVDEEKLMRSKEDFYLDRIVPRET